jgi:F-type H+-transporting ATPase subunit b
MIGLIFGAAGHSDQGINWFEIIALWANFFILLFLLPKIIKSLTGASPKEHLQNQRNEIARQLKEAEVKQAEAEKRLTEYAKKLDNLENEVKEIMAGYEAQGKADEEKAEAEAEQRIERLMRDADFTVNQESLKAQRAIRQAAIDATIELSETIINDRITDADRRRLADEYISNIAES